MEPRASCCRGRVALLAAFLLAISPVNVVANRDNIVDSLLVFTLLLATWAVVRATERASLGWLVAGGVLVGLAFNIKMLQAYLIVPALVLLFLLGARLPLRKRSVGIGLMLAAMLLVSLSWVTIVDAVPATQRPFVGSSNRNSEMELVLGYNGILRIFGRPPAPPPRSRTPRAVVPQLLRTPLPRASMPAQPQQRPSPDLMGAYDPNGPGPLRLLGPLLGGQAGWELLLALFGLFSTVWRLGLREGVGDRRKERVARRQQSFLLWGTWAATAGIVFSVAKGIAPYYLAELAPAICALAAVGMYGLWRDYWSEAGIRSWLLPAALLATALEQVYLLTSVPTWLPWLSPVLLAISAGLGLALIVRRDPLRRWTGLAWVREGRAVGADSLRPAIAILGLIAVLVTPVLWTSGSLRNANAGGHPLSGPTLSGQNSTSIPSADPILLAYLRAHADDSRYLLATVSAGDATPLIFSTDDPVMALGGFSGADPILSVRQLQDAVSNGVVELFWLPSSNLSANQLRRYFPLAKTLPPTAYSNALARWVGQACAVVPPIQSMLHYSPRHVAPRLLFTCPFERPSI